jgi:hypothetical protein
LGNAILLNRMVDYNVQAKPFADKKRTYIRLAGRSPLPSVQDVCRYDVWDAKAVHGRTDAVAKTLTQSLQL